MFQVPDAILTANRLQVMVWPSLAREWALRADSMVPSDERAIRQSIRDLPAMWRQLVLIKGTLDRWDSLDLIYDEQLQAVQRVRDRYVELRDDLREAEVTVREIASDAVQRGIITREEADDGLAQLFGDDYGTLGIEPVTMGFVLGLLVGAIALVWVTGYWTRENQLALKSNLQATQAIVGEVNNGLVVRGPDNVPVRNPDGTVVQPLRDLANSVTPGIQSTARAAGTASVSAAVGVLAIAGVVAFAMSKKGGR